MNRLFKTHWNGLCQTTMMMMMKLEMMVRMIPQQQRLAFLKIQTQICIVISHHQHLKYF